MDVLDTLIRYEQDDLTGPETVELFAHLVRTGIAWSLQGHYGRTAVDMIEAGFISQAGEVTYFAEGPID